MKRASALAALLAAASSGGLVGPTHITDLGPLNPDYKPTESTPLRDRPRTPPSAKRLRLRKKRGWR